MWCPNIRKLPIQPHLCSIFYGQRVCLQEGKGLLRDEARSAGIESLTQMSDLISFKNRLTIVEDFASDIGQYAATIAADGIDYSGKNADIGTSRAKFEGWKAGFGVAGAVMRNDGTIKLFIYMTEPKTTHVQTNPEAVELEWAGRLICLLRQ